jgi:hypothetical protein
MIQFHDQFPQDASHRRYRTLKTWDFFVFVSGPFQSHAQTPPQQNAKFGPNIKEPGWV